jgi:TfoX/Sxy family transcriptional regulator of competence genes
MFGGYGIFIDDTMFALVDGQGQRYLRSDASLASELERNGGTRHGRMPYWSVPDDSSLDTLLNLAKKAIEAARSAK